MYRIKLDRVSRRRNIIRYQSFSMNESIEDMFYEDVSCSFFFFFCLLSDSRRTIGF